MSMSAASYEEMLATFCRLGLDVRTAEQTAKSAKVGPSLLSLSREAGLERDGCEKAVGVLLLHLASRLQPASAVLHLGHRQDVLDCITSRGIRSVPQLDAACDYLRRGGAGGGAAAAYSRAEMERVSGVGVAYSEQEMRAACTAVCDANAASLLSERWRALGRLLSAVNSRLPWADGRRLKELLEQEVETRVGKRSEDDAQPAISTASGSKRKQANGSAGEVAAASASASASSSSASSASASTSSLASPSPSFLSLPPPADGASSASVLSSYLSSIDGREIIAARNTARQQAEHEASVPRGCVRTRFPPEPNGHLHLGHAKAMNFNFGLAKYSSGGQCLLRFDDTNPEAEREDYITQIIAAVRWLGHQPSAITYSSDYFPQLYELAVRLIRSGHAYVDHQTAAEIKASREQRGGSKTASPWRERPVDESLRLFDAMRCGRFEEGAATLRMKGDLSHPNPQMWDLVAYRIKYHAHPHVGDRWCIYPSYDYTHCLVDSIENITHSCCTLEFEVRRESYYWLLSVLDLYKPRVWEYSRLNVEHSVMSKRRLLQLVEQGHVSGWDDPRLLTLSGLRRRGYSPRALTDFCNAIGISRSETMIPMQQLEHWCRNDLETRARRAMVVLDPLQVELDNFPADRVEQLGAPDFPKAPQLGSHWLPFSRLLWIDRADARLQDEKDFFGLAPGKEVHLKYAYNVRWLRAETDPLQPERIVRLHCSVDLSNSSRPKGKIHWVAQPSPGQPPLQLECRLYSQLFLSKDPMALDDWLSDLNPDSLRLVQGAMADPTLLTAAPGSSFQFERVAFFVADRDSTAQRLVFNRTVELRESRPKQADGRDATDAASAKKQSGSQLKSGAAAAH